MITGIFTDVDGKVYIETQDFRGDDSFEEFCEWVAVLLGIDFSGGAPDPFGPPRAFVWAGETFHLAWSEARGGYIEGLTSQREVMENLCKALYKDPDFCTLYIESEETLAELDAVIQGACRGIMSGLDVTASTHANKAFNEGGPSVAPHDYTQRARYCAMVHVDDNPRQVTDFQTRMSAMITRLRRDGRRVTADCDFADLLRAATG